MRFLFYNIAHCRGMNGSPLSYLSRPWKYVWPGGGFGRQICSWIRSVDPDIAFFAEIDTPHTDLFHEELGSTTYEKYSDNRYAPGSLLRKLPVFRKHDFALFTKQKSKKMRTHFFDAGIKRAVCVTHVSPTLTFIGVHLAVFKGARTKQLKELSELCKSTPGKIVLGGDFNVLTGLHEFADFLRETGLTMVSTAPTFPSHKPKHSLDHFFVSPSLQVSAIELPLSHHSDHLPVAITVHDALV